MTYPVPSPMTHRDGSAAAWLGGDVGWPCGPFTVFGDTYVGPAGSAQRRSGAAGGVVGNTVWAAGRFYCGGSAAAPDAFFADAAGRAGGTRLCAWRPFAYNGRLYVFLYRKDRVSGAQVGGVLARVENPAAPPPAWDVSYLTTTTEGAAAGVPAFGVEAFADPPDLVVYGTLAGKTVAVTVPLAAIESTPDGGVLFSPGVVRHLAASGAWAPGYAGPDWWDCGVDVTAGFSARYVPSRDRWRVVTTDTSDGGGFPDHALAGDGPGPFGPWDWRVLGYFPGMTGGLPAYDPDNAAYCLSEVPDPAGAGFVSVVYTLGSRAGIVLKDTTRQLADAGVYVVESGRYADPFGGS